MDWQPIETAPKRFGTYLLLTDGQQVVPAETWDDGTTQGYYDLTKWDRDGNDDVSFGPTHWMPLPAPPAIAMETGTAIDSEAGVVAKP